VPASDFWLLFAQRHPTSEITTTPLTIRRKHWKKDSDFRLSPQTPFQRHRRITGLGGTESNVTVRIGSRQDLQREFFKPSNNIETTATACVAVATQIGPLPAHDKVPKNDNLLLWQAKV
jgi:hypothetical protein